MKTTLNIFLVMIVAAFASCSKSDSDTLPGEDGQGPASNSYWPFAIGNTWNLVNTEDANDKSQYLIHKSITHDGKTYFQFKPIGTDLDVEITNGVREDNGVFTELHGAVENSGLKVSPGTVTYINTKLNVGAVWKDEVTLNLSGVATGTLKHVNEGKILEKTASETINGKSYKDVIKTQLKKSVTNSITGLTFTITYEMWLAKGVGIIYEKNTYSDTEITRYSLINYSLK